MLSMLIKGREGAGASGFACTDGGCHMFGVMVGFWWSSNVYMHVATVESAASRREMATANSKRDISLPSRSLDHSPLSTMIPTNLDGAKQTEAHSCPPRWIPR